jgi:predicted TIM-barrel fold metal-dependent hydrolase
MNRHCAWYLCVSAFVLSTTPLAHAQAAPRAVFNDSHLHLTNYIQRGVHARDILQMMGDSIPRSTLFGIPLQQEWLDAVTGANAPTYYLHSDAPLYYYSFTDAYIAMEYLGLSASERRRFDPMITGFNPGDMYAADHIRRVLRTFPGVFEGIGEFTIHKEFVSDKVRPGPASVLDPALDSILSAAAEIGLVVILHSDMDVPFASDTAAPAYLEQMKALFRRHPQATIIWAHTGVGRVVRPVKRHAQVLAAILGDPAFRNVYFDISWDVVAKYFVSSPETIRTAAELINRYPDRFLFGSDAVAPRSPAAWFVTYDLYAPLWAALSPDASRQVQVGNYERLFNAARRNVRAWEAAHPER